MGLYSGNIRGHRTYFMPKQLYELAHGSEAQQEPFNTLTTADWLAVLHHLHAHEIECARHRGASLRMLGWGTPRYVLANLVQDYLAENNAIEYNEGKEELSRGGGLLPEKERPLFEKTKALRQKLKDYKTADISPENEEVFYDLLPKAVTASP